MEHCSYDTPIQDKPAIELKGNSQTVNNIKTSRMRRRREVKSLFFMLSYYHKTGKNSSLVVYTILWYWEYGVIELNDRLLDSYADLFARAFHSDVNRVCIFRDTVAQKLIGAQQYNETCLDLVRGIGMLNPTFSGTIQEALRWIADNKLSDLPLARSAFAETSFETAAALGAEQYLLVGAGFDTFAYRKPSWAKNLRVFEIEDVVVSADKQQRLARADIVVPDGTYYIWTDVKMEQWGAALQSCSAYDRTKTAFSNLMGLSWRLDKPAFERFLQRLNLLTGEGSSVVFDYRDDIGEAMTDGYSYRELERMLSRCGYHIYEHLNPGEMERQYFAAYNRRNPKYPIHPAKDVNYCLAVKKIRR